MAEIPVPASDIFRDFVFDLVEYEVVRKDKSLSKLKGLPDIEDGNRYINFPLGSDIAVGDELRAGTTYLAIRKISIETYQGKPAIIKVLY